MSRVLTSVTDDTRPTRSRFRQWMLSAQWQPRGTSIDDLARDQHCLRREAVNQPLLVSAGKQTPCAATDRLTIFPATNRASRNRSGDKGETDTQCVLLIQVGCLCGMASTQRSRPRAYPVCDAMRCDAMQCNAMPPPRCLPAGRHLTIA